MYLKVGDKVVVKTGSDKGKEGKIINVDRARNRVTVEGVHIEVKRVEKLNVENALKQAERDKKENEMATVFHRKNREEWKVTLRLDDFINLYKELKDKESKIQDLEKRELWR